MKKNNTPQAVTVTESGILVLTMQAEAELARAERGFRSSFSATHQLGDVLRRQQMPAVFLSEPLFASAVRRKYLNKPSNQGRSSITSPNEVVNVLCEVSEQTDPASLSSLREVCVAFGTDLIRQRASTLQFRRSRRHV
jgi:hypothetical protein